LGEREVKQATTFSTDATDGTDKGGFKTKRLETRTKFKLSLKSLIVLSLIRLYPAFSVQFVLKSFD